MEIHYSELPYGNDLNQYAKVIHEIAKSQGYWDGEHDYYYTMANAVAELGEGLDEYRRELPNLYYRDANGKITYNLRQSDEAKPLGLCVEVVDCMIWLLDYLYQTGINIDDVMRRKIRHNATRGYLHGHERA